ncbi:hypothetical protein [Atopobacter phocae]|uniref:hypothetical protein n=1 Tax=Atopobacter phocae TaxID=136492 RepID=UPI00046FD5DF|nr:hypothetical protein [Atopobacter phocae]
MDELNKNIKTLYAEKKYEQIGQLIFSDTANQLKVTEDNYIELIDSLIRLKEWILAQQLLNQLPNRFTAVNSLQQSFQEELQTTIQSMKNQLKKGLNISERYHWYESWLRLPDDEEKYYLSKEMLLERQLTKAERADYLSLMARLHHSINTDTEYVQYFADNQFKSIDLSQLMPLDQTEYWINWPQWINEFYRNDSNTQRLVEQEFRMFLIEHYPHLEEHLGIHYQTFFEGWLNTLDWLNAND